MYTKTLKKSIRTSMCSVSADIFKSKLVDHYVTDKNGCQAVFHRIADIGFNLPLIPFRTSLEHFLDIEAFPDDVVICGYLKSGTHWVWEIANMIMLKSSQYVPKIKEEYMFEHLPIVESHSKLERPRVFNSHMPPRLLPPDVLAKRSRLIYLLRDPKDVAVSYYHHMINLIVYGYKGTWDGFLGLFLDGNVECGKLSTYLKEWENFIEHNEVHVIHYEELKQNPSSEIRRLADFLHADIDDDLVREISSQTDFDKMKESKAAYDPEIFKDVWVDRKPMMYRKGIVGDWKNWFTVSQSEYFDEVFEKEGQDGLQ